MGLHLHTNQSFDEAEISVHGELSGTALTQIEAAIRHFRERGCKVIHVNVEQSCSKSGATYLGSADDLFFDYSEFAIR